MTLPRRPLTVLAILVAFAVAVAVFIRIRFGVDFSDESFYLSMPLRFVLGDKPFIDELNIAQTAGVVAWPLIGVFFKLTHSTTGIVLVARTMLVLIQAGVGAAVFRALRRTIDTPAALMIASACVLFWPINIPGLSYNTLGCTFFTLGLFLPLGELLEGRPPRRAILAASGAAHALASFCYPTLLLAALTFNLILLLRLRGEERLWLFHVAGAGAVALVVSPLILRAGPSGLKHVFHYSFAGGMGGDGRLVRAFHDLTNAWPHSPWLLAAWLVFAGVACRFAPRVARFAAFALPFVAADTAWEGVLRTAGFIVYYSLFALPVAWGLRDRSLARRMLLFLWFPAFVGGAVTAWTSSNGGIAASIGLFPASLATSTLIVAFISERAPNAARLGLSVAAPLIALVIMVYFLFDGLCAYRDAALADMPVRVDHGPFKGLWTTDAKQQFLLDVEKAVNHRARRGARALFYYDFPAGYLMTATRPATASAWIFPNPARSQFDADEFERHFRESGRVLVLKLRNWWPKYEYLEIDVAVHRHCKRVEHDAEFDILEEL